MPTKILGLLTLLTMSAPLLAQNQTVADLIAPYPLPVQYATASEDVQVAYIKTGQGETTLIFVHGLGSYVRGWEKTWPAFANSYQCIALDLPGFGRSSKGAYSQSMAFYRDAILAVMDAENIQQAILVGHSMGGQASLYTALENPDRVLALALSAPAGIETFTEQEATALRNAYTPETYGGMVEAQVRYSYGLNFHVWQEDAEPWVADRLAMREADDFQGFATAWVKSVGGMLDSPVYARLGEIMQPVWVAYGAEDQLIPNRYLHTTLTTEGVGGLAKAAMPQAEVQLIPDAGHFVHFEQSEEFNSRLLMFLKTIQ
ncbi:MAG TPA: alpha/beta hydrolase [Cytophagales bacterium]|nr:alpha/beta hydrolase [Cytophagales bacterium]HAP57989.1 alpha/beta hydrolase [Cytophagales bacterium]